MKIKRTFARNMREALKKVREEHGTEAVILSKKKVADGYEVISALEFDEDLIFSKAESSEASNIRDGESNFWSKEQASMFGQNNKKLERQKSSFDDEFEDDTVSISSKAASINEQSPLDKSEVKFEASDNKVASDNQTKKFNSFLNKVEWTQDPVLEEMRAEIRSLRGLFEDQLSVLEWGGMSRRNPNRASILKRLHSMGFGRDICRKLVDGIDAEGDLESSWRKVLKYLVQGIDVTNDDILEHGGVVAVVGPTGVGKTTTVAKLAARYCLRHGKGQVALVTTDCYRIGAHEQLRNFGKILGVPVYVASSEEELRGIVESLSDKPLVLIDTAGMSQRDVQLAEQLKALQFDRDTVKTYLAVSANTQLQTLNETVRVFSKVDLSGCILTKVDESASLGSAITVLIRHRLPIAYIGNGQRVPEDLQQARSEYLVETAVEVAGDCELDEEGFAVAFAGFDKDRFDNRGESARFSY